MALPSTAADDAAFLEFSSRRARAHKAPYIVTWTLRDAMIWRTPKPGRPATRDSLEKLKDYPDLYEIAAGDTSPLSEPVRLKVLARGGCKETRPWSLSRLTRRISSGGFSM
jgi:hypothetical protein